MSTRRGVELSAQRKCTLFAVSWSTMLAATRSLQARSWKKRIRNECEIDAESTECVHTMTDDEWWVHRSTQQFIIILYWKLYQIAIKNGRAREKKCILAIKSSLTCAWETRSRFVVQRRPTECTGIVWLGWEGLGFAGKRDSRISTMWIMNVLETRARAHRST